MSMNVARWKITCKSISFNVFNGFTTNQINNTSAMTLGLSRITTENVILSL